MAEGVGLTSASPPSFSARRGLAANRTAVLIPLPKIQAPPPHGARGRALDGGGSGIDFGVASVFLRSPGARCESNRGSHPFAENPRPDPTLRMRSGLGWRREWDSNPRYPFGARFFSKEVLSTTQPPDLSK